jgi:hypothetical protein
MTATVNSTVSVLWQIDIGFYDELPWIQRHVIKGKKPHLRWLTIFTNFRSLANCEFGSRGEFRFKDEDNKKADNILRGFTA